MASPSIDPLDEYLQGSYREELAELDRADELLSKVWPLFKYSQVDGCWPYEVVNGDTPNQIELSFSTNSMILFTIGVGLGIAEEGGPLGFSTPSRRQLPDTRAVAGKYVEGFKKIVVAAKRNVEKQAKPRFVFRSNSFGLDDPFTLSWVIELIRADRSPFANEVSSAELAKFTKHAEQAALSKVESVFKNPSKPVLCWDTGDKMQLDHAFPVLRTIQTWRSLSPRAKGDRPKRKNLGSLLDENVRPFLSSRLHQQLSFSAIPNSNFDAAELVFALEGLILIADDPRGEVEPSIVDRCFKVLEETQHRSPYWRPLKPFVTTPAGLALLPLSVEIANSLLRICSAVDSDEKSLFTNYLSLFTCYAEWLRTRLTRVEIKFAQDGKIISHPVWGWHSEHVYSPQRIHPWETAQVVLFLLRYRELLTEHIRRVCLRKANFSVTQPRREEKSKQESVAEYWKAEWEGNEPLLGIARRDGRLRAYTAIRERFLEPRDRTLKKNRSRKPACSMLLYGPPGTGKTSIAEELAKALQWKLITVTPSDFIAKGEAEVEARAKSIFAALNRQKDVVILFDEIDRLILDRDSPSYEKQGDLFQFMTPSMLVKLRDLRAQAGAIFVIATNYEERIDPAAKRVGRIDEKFLICPPGRAQRFEIIKKLAKKQFMKSLHTDRGEQEFEARFTTAVADNLLRRTIFETYGTMKMLSEDTAESFTPTNKWPGISQYLSRAEELQRKAEAATIRLGTYDRRFPNNGDASKVPLAEFFLLVRLKIEAATLEPDECKLIMRVFKGFVATGDLSNWRTDMSASKKLKEALSRTLGDEDVAIRIADLAQSLEK